MEAGSSHIQRSVDVVPDVARGALQRIIEQLDIDLVEVQHRIILVTGSQTGDGASTITRWLQSLLASTREGDLLCVNASMQTEPEDGGIAVDARELSRQVRPTAIPRVYVLDLPDPSSGRGPSLNDIGHALAELRERFTWIIIDSPPPSCFSPRSAFLVQQADGVLIVLEANRTDREQAQITVDLVRQNGGRVIGALFNKSST